MGLYSISEKENFSFFDKLDNGLFKFIYLLGADDINFEKKDKFIVYQGSHGDKGAEIADIVLPGAAYTEKNGLFVNLEGKIQNAYKASYPPGDAQEDWKIIQDLSKMLKKREDYKDIHQLQKIIKSKIILKNNNNLKNTKKVEFIEKEILIKAVDYYFTNSIARSSKTMNECRRVKKNFLFTGIDKAS